MPDLGTVNHDAEAAAVWDEWWGTLTDLERAEYAARGVGRHVAPVYATGKDAEQSVEVIESRVAALAQPSAPALPAPQFSAEARVAWRWIADTKSHRVRSGRTAAFVLVFAAPSLCGAQTVGQLAATFGLSERHLQECARRLRTITGKPHPLGT